MNKSIKIAALSLFIISCIVCTPVWGREKKQKEANQKPRSSKVYIYSDNTKEWKKNPKLRDVTYDYAVKPYDQEKDASFVAPSGGYTKFCDPDAELGINYIKRVSRDFE